MAALNTSDGTQVDHTDWGTRQSVMFSHGWPLSADARESFFQSIAK